MAQESRVKKTLLNARVNLIFYFLTLALSFFSRKIFLDCLGADFLGLTGSLVSLLGFLNLAELGIGTVVGYTLYKPIYDQDQQKINEIISVFGYFYRWVGAVIFVGGLILAGFFPLIYPDTGFDYGIIYFAYFSFLFSSLIGYFVNYRQTLLGADQRNYVVTAYFQTAGLIKTLIQMALAYYTGNYYLWVIVEFVFGILYAVILNWKINQVYPWLKTDVRSGKRLRNRYPEISQKVRQIFIHKVGGVVYSQSTPLLIYAYGSLQTVAYYGNYTLICGKLGSLLGGILGSTAASVGNLIAEGNKQRILSVYWELLAIRFWIAGIFSFALYHLLPPFIELWLGSEYVMSANILILVILAFVLGIIRTATDEFKEGYGLFSDVWAPFVECSISITIAVVCGKYWGLSGVLLGGIISTLVIVYIWHPYYLFTRGLKCSVMTYVLQFLKNVTVLFVCYYISSILVEFILPSFYARESWIMWIVYAVLVVGIFSLVSFFLMNICISGLRSFTKRVFKRL